MIFGVAILIALIGGAAWQEEQNNINECYVGNSDSKITGSTGDWTKKGTKAYNTAKAMFTDWVKRGMSGSQAAGIGGNSAGAEDPSFKLDQMEIGYGGDLSRGGGLYQFTPVAHYIAWAKTHNKYKIWSVESQAEYVINGPDYKGRVQKYISSSNGKSPGQAAVLWMNIYERPSASAASSSAASRSSAAEKMYQLFGGEKFKGNNSILGAAVKSADDAQSEGQMDCDDDSIPSSGNWGWPFSGMSYSSAKTIIKGEPYQGFGYTGGGRVNGYHDGVDFGTAKYNNKTIRAIHGGKVTKIGHSGYTNDTLGWYVWVTSSDGWNEIYQEFAFSDSDKTYIKVKVGQTIKTGDAIGYLTQHGNVNHVHIGVTKKSFENAIGHSFDPSGGWHDPIEIIKNGMNKSKDDDKNEKTKSDNTK
ncbi:phage tail tip lysozyme [uncultured Lactobacillus sp.]|uniref:phage tail tip lysozyme n=1 Tax=uncultured Lactobacillus sp. TaxID=153152 RepID=UPI0026155D46|nr:phage tail tip lysozyme [uncultured Lactobacillus sp.]